MVDVAAESPGIWEARDVPHGSVEINWQKSTAINGETRWFWVYTPPGMRRMPGSGIPCCTCSTGRTTRRAVDAGGARQLYPGQPAGGEESGPVIIVMPFGHAVPFGARGGQGEQYGPL
jgi:hypothetical protein